MTTSFGFADVPWPPAADAFSTGPNLGQAQVELSFAAGL
jgi:hypothetical protein